MHYLTKNGKVIWYKRKCTHCNDTLDGIIRQTQKRLLFMHQEPKQMYQH